MTVTFNDVLVCDVSSTEFEGKNYYKLFMKRAHCIVSVFPKHAYQHLRKLSVLVSA